MSEKLDEVLQKLSELNDTVREHSKAGDEATLDKDALEEEVRRILAELEDEKPVRKGEVVVSDTVAAPLGIKAIKEAEVRSGKYDGVKLVDLWFARHLCQAAARKAIPNGDRRRLLGLADSFGNEIQIALKAMGSTTSGYGDELIGEAFAGQVWDDVHLATKVAGLFGPPYAMQAEKDTFPLNLGSMTFRLGTQNTVTTATDLSTKNVQLDASQELLAEVNLSYQLTEDTIIPLIPEMRRTFARNAAETLDNVILNGDTTNAATGNINSDDADPDDDAMYLIWDGLRHLALVDNTSQVVNQAAAPDVDMFIDAGKKLGKYFAQPERCAFIMDIQTYLACLKIDELLTVDKIGTRATLLTGQMASIFNCPVIVSGEMGLTEADGKISDTAANNTLGQVVLVHRAMWKLGFRRQILVEADRDIQKRQNIIVVSFRPAFNCYGGGASDRSSQTHTAVVRNITV